MPLSELTVDLSKMCGPSRLGPPLDTPSTPPLDALDARTELGPRHPSMLPLMQPLDAPRCRPSSPSMSVVVGVTLDALDVDPRRPLDDPSMRPRYSTPPAQGHAWRTQRATFLHAARDFLVRIGCLVGSEIPLLKLSFTTLQSPTKLGWCSGAVVAYHTRRTLASHSRRGHAPASHAR